MKRLSMIVISTLLVLAAAGCDDDPARPKDTTPSPYNDLTEKWHVLSNLERAYDERNIARYAEVFDQDNFVFHFNPGDVANGDTPEQWGYVEEYNSASNMFSGAGGQNNNPILSIDLTLKDVESATWTEVEDTRFPGESLWSATINYTYYIDTEADIQFITQGAPKAQFIVREIDGKWKLVTWYDLQGTYQARAQAASTRETTWGQVKVLYGGS
jgi:hypothetical protein